MRHKSTAFSDGSSPRRSKNSVLARWLPLAILLSLSAHIAFLWWTRSITWRNLAAISTPPQPVRPFRLIKPPIPPDPASVKKRPPSQPSLAIPVEKREPHPTVGTLPLETASALPKIHPALLQEKPGVIGSSLDPTIQKMVAEGARKAHQEMDSFSEQISSPQSTRPLTELLHEAGDAAQIASAGGRPGSIPQGFSDLDALLSQTGPLKSGTAPILMPTDVLFDYDNADLQDQAVGSLRKLGMLIQRNPRATFLIEGHTDSFGSDAYNRDLSLRRAEAVKTWLLQTMKISAERIETKGYGKTRLLVPASGTIEQQQINRRVEIVIRVPKNPL